MDKLSFARESNTCFLSFLAYLSLVFLRAIIKSADISPFLHDSCSIPAGLHRAFNSRKTLQFIMWLIVTDFSQELLGHLESGDTLRIVTDVEAMVPISSSWGHLGLLIPVCS